MWTLRYSIKQTDFPVPLVPGLYKLLDNADAHLPLMQVCSPLLVD